MENYDLPAEFLSSQMCRTDFQNVENDNQSDGDLSSQNFHDELQDILNRDLPE